MVRTLFMATTLGLLSTTAQGAVVVAFEGVSGASVAASVEGTGVAGFDLGRSAGLLANTGSTFNSRDWTIGGTKQDAIDNNDAIFWGATVTGTSYDLTSLTIDYDRSGNGPTAIAIDLFIDGANQGEIFSNTSVLDSSTQTANIDLTSFTNVSGSLFFRLVGWNAVNGAGTFDIENDLPGGFGIVLEGDLVTTPVPLPASLPLLAAGLGGAAFVARRRRK